MVVPQKTDSVSGNFPSDESIMAEVQKLKGWKDEGIDTEELETLLFSDLDAYNRLKIKILTERLERSAIDNVRDIGLNEKSKSPMNLPEIVPQNSVITNNTMEGQKNIDYPPSNSDRMGIPPSISESDHRREEPIRLGRLKIDRRKSRIALLSIFAVIVVITISGIGSYILFFGPDDNPKTLTASFTVSDQHPISGSIIDLSSTELGKEVIHSWNIIPGEFELLEGSPSSSNISMYFTKMGEYRISHTVKRGGETKELSTDITVTKRTIRIDRERTEDRTEYDVKGSLRLENVDSLFDFPDVSDFSTMALDFSSKEGSPSVSRLGSGDPTFKDGYGETYSTILRTLEHNLDISGSITDVKDTIIPFEGNIETDEKNHIDLFNRRLARMDVTSRMRLDIQVQAGKTKHVDRMERSELFPDLTSEYKDLRLEDIAIDRYISEDGFGTVQWGASLLKWKVEGIEIFMGNPCLNVSLGMEPATLSDNDLEEFSMELLLSDALPVASRTFLHMKSTSYIPNPYDMITIQNLVGFDKGTSPIIYNTLDSFHENTTNIFSIYPDMISEYDDIWTYTPEQGTKTSSIPSDFDAEKAISEFSDKPAFKNFIQGLTDPYALYCNFSSMEGRGELWKFSISDRSNPFGWNESVLKGNSVTSGFKTRIDPVKVGKSSIGGVMTFSGAETVLKRLMSSIDTTYGKSLYGVTPGAESKLDMDKMSILLIAEHKYPSIGLLNKGTFQKIDYGFIIRSSDNNYEACIDMHSGQLLYLYSSVKV